jgi:hypothetical protein
MSTRTTVTLDDDVLDRVKDVSRSRGVSFKDALNDLVRTGLLHLDHQPTRRPFKIKPVHMGYRSGLNYDNVESLIEYAEGDQHR